MLQLGVAGRNSILSRTLQLSLTLSLSHENVLRFRVLMMHSPHESRHTALPYAALKNKRNNICDSGVLLLCFGSKQISQYGTPRVLREDVVCDECECVKATERLMQKVRK